MKSKFGFTLAELLGVIVIMAVIAMIVFPIVEENIKDGRDRSLKEIINNIENSGYYYSLENELGYSEIYKTISLQQLKEAGVLKYGDKIINPVNNSELNGCVAYRWYDNKYQFKYIEPCNVDLVVTITNRNGKFNQNGWANESFWVDINTSGTSLKYCVGTNSCTPNTTVNSANNSVYVLAEGSNYICAQAINQIDTSQVVCEQFNLDKTVPDLAKTDIYYNGGSRNIKDLLNVVAGKSGYTVSCDRNNTLDLNNVVSNAKCTIVGNNGKSVTKEIKLMANYLIPANIADTKFLNISREKTEVESITLVDNTTSPTGAVSKADVSKYKNGSIMVWYLDSDSNGLYEMYIGQDGGVIVNDASYLFSGFTKVTSIDLRELDTDKLTNYTDMFLNINDNITITVKDTATQSWIQQRLREVGKTATVQVG